MIESPYMGVGSSTKPFTGQSTWKNYNFEAIGDQVLDWPRPALCNMSARYLVGKSTLPGGNYDGAQDALDTNAHTPTNHLATPPRPLFCCK